MSGRRWKWDEVVLAMNLYCRLPFGRLHKGTPEIIELARYLDRTPSSVALKMVNLASLDPVLAKRGIKGMSNASNLDREVWESFQGNWELLSFESQKAYLKIQEFEKADRLPDIPWLAQDIGETEAERTVRVRLVQGFFRESVLASYRQKCAFCGFGLHGMLNASHIIPWSQSVERRADPTNGLCLCAFHDRAFDRGIMAVDDNMEIMISRKAKAKEDAVMHRVGITEMEGQQIHLPDKFCPDPSALDYHRKRIFVS